MKSALGTLILIFLFLTNSCISSKDPLKEGNAEVVINVASRGAYQFLIRYENDLFYPENLPAEYQIIVQEPIPVFIKFNLTEEKADIFTPAPNDVPVFLKSIPVIRLVEIKRL
jgi:hypothetical protein